MAARDNGFTAKAGRKIAVAAAEQRYRTAMREFAAQTFLDVWYAHLDIDLRKISCGSRSRPEVQARREAAGQGPHRRQHEGAGQADHRGRRAAPDHQRPADRVRASRSKRRSPRRRAGRRDTCPLLARAVLGKYRRTLQSDRRHLLEQFTLVQVAEQGGRGRRLGTRAWVLLMDTRRMSRCSCRPRRPSRRCWRSTAGGVSSSPRRCSWPAPPGAWASGEARRARPARRRGRHPLPADPGSTDRVRVGLCRRAAAIAA